MKYNYLLLSVFLSLNQLMYAALPEKEEANQVKIPITISKQGEELEDNDLKKLLKDEPAVEILNLVNNNLTNNCIDYIGNCEKIKFLNLAGNILINYEGITTLLSTIDKMPIINSLETLHLSSTNFSEDQRQCLHRHAAFLDGLQINFNN